jgi:hypothetical protein
MSSASAVPTTVTVSLTPAACKLRSRENSCAATRCNPVYSRGVKFDDFTEMVYVDGARPGTI